MIVFLAAFLGSVAGLLIAGTVLTAWGSRRERVRRKRVRRTEADLFKRCAVNAVNIGRVAVGDYERGYWAGRRDQSLAHYNAVSDEPFTLEDGRTFPPRSPDLFPDIHRDGDIHVGREYAQKAESRQNGAIDGEIVDSEQQPIGNRANEESE